MGQDSRAGADAVIAYRPGARSARRSSIVSTGLATFTRRSSRTGRAVIESRQTTLPSTASNPTSMSSMRGGAFTSSASRSRSGIPAHPALRPSRRETRTERELRGVPGEQAPTRPRLPPVGAGLASNPHIADSAGVTSVPTRPPSCCYPFGGAANSSKHASGGWRPESPLRRALTARAAGNAPLAATNRAGRPGADDRLRSRRATVTWVQPRRQRAARDGSGILGQMEQALAGGAQVR